MAAWKQLIRANSPRALHILMRSIGSGRDRCWEGRLGICEFNVPSRAGVRFGEYLEVVFSCRRSTMFRQFHSKILQMTLDLILRR